MLQGTLDLLILRTLLLGPAHGHAIAKAIEFRSDDVLQVEQGSLYPALHRLIKRNWISAEDGTSENNRRAKFYSLTPKGRAQLDLETRKWDKFAGAIARILRPANRRTNHDQPRKEAPPYDPESDIQNHIEIETQDNIARGMSPEEARYAAIRKFGNVTRTIEDTREVWAIHWLDHLVQDLRFALRGIRKSPLFATVVVLTLALGIGANTAIFTIIDAVMFRSIPVSDSEILLSSVGLPTKIPISPDILRDGDCHGTIALSPFRIFNP